MKAVVYLRISQDRTGEEAGVTRQREDCERRVKERGWSLVEVHSDNDISASKGRRRPGFEAVLKALEEDRADVVVAWTIDRLQRDRRDELRLYELCREKDATISLARGPDIAFDTPTGRYMADNLGALARMEIELKSDRQRRAQVQAATAGRRVGGRRPFGYERDGVTVRPDEAALIRQAYADFLAGASLSSIARTWNEAGLLGDQKRWKGKKDDQGRPAEAAPWVYDTVRQVLLNPRYAGKRAYQGEVVADAVWPALVPEETWLAVRSVIKDPGRRVGPRPARHLLSGIAVCGICGAKAKAGGGNRPGVPGYRCSGSAGHFGRKAQPCDEFVTAVALARLGQPDAADLLVDRTKPDTTGMREQANALRQRLDSVAAEFADGDLTASQLRTITTRLREKLSAIEMDIADATRVDIIGPLVNAEDVEAMWDSLDLDKRRAVIDLLMTVRLHPPGRGTRTFRPESVDIVWKA